MNKDENAMYFFKKSIHRNNQINNNNNDNSNKQKIKNKNSILLIEFVCQPSLY